MPITSQPFESTAEVNGVRLFYQVTGNGFPIVFVHEYGGDYRSWTPQVSAFSRRFRCFTYSHRGFFPSECPPGIADFSQDQLIADLRSLFDVWEINSAHVVGFSMGASVALNFALRYPSLCRSLVATGCGGGVGSDHARLVEDADEMAALIEQLGMSGFADLYAEGPPRAAFKRKDPLGWALFRDQMKDHDRLGHINAVKGVIASRPTMFELEPQLVQLDVPTLLVVGDEDEAYLEPEMFLLHHIRRSGLAVIPQSGHTVNLEEPGLYNYLLGRFWDMVDADTWNTRPSVANPSLLPSKSKLR